MKPVKQKHLHNPDQGILGDCYRACISTITEIPLDELPDPNNYGVLNWDKYMEEVHHVLERYDWELYAVDISKFKYEGLPIIASGLSPRSTPGKQILHAVVWDKCLVHDPHPDNTGIKDIRFFEYLIRKG